MDIARFYGILLAQQSRLESMGGGFRGRRTRIDTSDMVVGALVICGIVFFIWCLSQMTKLQERRLGYSCASTLFLSLCRAHKLSLKQIWLLWRLTRFQKLRDPARLFLEPTRLESVNLGPSLRLRADEMQKIHQQLFCDLDDLSAEQHTQ